MEEKLKLFELENPNDELYVGKKIWDLSAQYPRKSIKKIVKMIKHEDINFCRQAYWTYVFREVCQLRKNLELQGNGYLLVTYKNYLFMNYVKFLRFKVKDVDYITPEFCREVLDLFLKTNYLSEKELRMYIKNLTQKQDVEYPVYTKDYIQNKISELESCEEKSDSKTSEAESYSKVLEELNIEKIQLQNQNEYLSEKCDDLYKQLKDTNKLFEEIKNNINISTRIIVSTTMICSLLLLYFI